MTWGLERGGHSGRRRETGGTEDSGRGGHHVEQPALGGVAHKELASGGHWEQLLDCRNSLFLPTPLL